MTPCALTRRQVVVALTYNAAVAVFLLACLWNSGYLTEHPADKWPQAWREASPLPEVFLATKQYLSEHGKLPKRKEDLNGIKVPSTGRLTTGAPIVARVIGKETWDEVFYLEDVLQEHTEVDASRLPLAWRTKAGGEGVLVIFFDGHVRQMMLDELDALVSAVTKEKRTTNAGAAVLPDSRQPERKVGDFPQR